MLIVADQRDYRSHRDGRDCHEEETWAIFLVDDRCCVQVRSRPGHDGCREVCYLPLTAARTTYASNGGHDTPWPGRSGPGGG